MNEIKHIKDDVGEIKTAIQKIASEYVTRTEYEEFKNKDYGLIKKAVLGFAGMILVAFLGFLISLAFKS